MFVARIFRNLDLGIEWILRCKAIELESLRCIVSRLKSTQDNFGKFIHQFRPDIKTLIRKLEGILIKLYGQDESLLFNQTCLNETLQPNYTHTHTYFIYIGLAVRVFANRPGDLGSIPGRVIPKTEKMVLDASLLNTQHYKVRIKGKVEQSREWSSALPYTLV